MDLLIYCVTWSQFPGKILESEEAESWKTLRMTGWWCFNGVANRSHRWGPAEGDVSGRSVFNGRADGEEGGAEGAGVEAQTSINPPPTSSANPRPSPRTAHRN